MKKLFSILCLGMMIIVSAGVNGQDLAPSVGPAPLTINTAPPSIIYNDANPNSRGFLYIGTAPFQFFRGFMANCTVTPVGSPFSVTFPGAFARHPVTGALYMNNQSPPFQLYIIDTTTGVPTLVVNMTGVPQANLTGMTWDPTTNTLYGVSTSITVSQIFTINTTTGVCTPIGSPSGVCAGAILICAAPNGSLFSTDIVADNLYKWDKTTGVATLRGPLGLPTNFGQDGHFDLSDGVFYWASYHSGPNLRILDTTNGSSTSICNYTGQAECLAVYPQQTQVVCNFTWGPQTSGTISVLNSVKAVSDLIGWAAGNTANVRRTTDGGTTWTNGNPNPGVINGTVYAIEAIDANTAWCTTSPTATFIYRTTNGGVNWTQVFTQANGFIDDIKFNNANTGFAMGDPVGGRWSLWKTSNGGVTWDSTGLYLVQAGGEAGWNNAMTVNGNNIWVGTSNTRIYKSTNYGATGSWTFGATTGLLNSFSLHFNSNTLGLVGGTTILKTTDGGATYSGVGTPPGTGNIFGLEGIDNDFWYGRGTGIFRSTNSGSNWTQVHTAAGTVNDIDFVTVSGCLVGWAVGSTGTIAKMTGTPVGIGNNNNQIPSTYILEQNYPNPFNPTTKISFALPKAGDVKLVVFDILGREVKTLVNELKQAGIYVVDFDATGLSSGVYFYKIQTKDFTDTKKMMIMK